jgi:uncharacterized membrane protein
MSEVPPSGPVDVGGSVLWALRTFRSNAVPLMATAAIVPVLGVPQQFATQPLAGYADCLVLELSGSVGACDGILAPQTLITFVSALVFVVASVLAQFAVIRMSLALVDGRPVTVGMAYSLVGTATFMGSVLVAIAAVAVGVVFCLIPGLVALFFLQLAPFAALDGRISVGGALKRSAQLVRRNAATALLLMAIDISAYLLGGLFFGVVTLLTLPFAALVSAHAYRQFTREPII